MSPTRGETRAAEISALQGAAPKLTKTIRVRRKSNNVECIIEAADFDPDQFEALDAAEGEQLVRARRESAMTEIIPVKHRGTGHEMLVDFRGFDPEQHEILSPSAFDAQAIADRALAAKKAFLATPPKGGAKR